MSTRLVQLFSNFVCERIPELTPEQITTFTVALTSQALPMDEFWLFMLAKRVQDTTSTFNAEQIVVIARRYAEKGLEDEEFFQALVDRVVASPRDFSPEQLAHFLLSCAKVRYLHEELCAMAFPLFQDPSLVAGMRAGTVSAAIAAASHMDRRDFRPMACSRALAAMAPRAVFESHEFAMGMVLAVTAFRYGAGIQLLLPRFLAHLDEWLDRVGSRLSRSSRREVGTMHRRVMLMGHCAALDVPRPQAWPLPLLRSVGGTLARLDEKLGGTAGGRDSYEPTPSSFHLEVVAVLRLLSVEHSLEQPQQPFRLDIVITPQQLQRAAELRAAHEAAMAEW